MSARSVRRLSRSDECPCTGATLARLVHPTVMMILAQGPRHGYRIAQEAARTPILAVNRPDRAGVYRVLRGLEKQGYVVSSWRLSESGPGRKVYRLTQEGRECLARWVETLADYHRAIGKLLAAARKARAADASSRRN